jgi:S1-C subfamily serine protease
MNEGTGHVQCFDAEGQPVATELVATLVLPGGQADILGLQAGDVLTHYAGEQLQGDAMGFIRMRKAEPADGPAQELRVRRGGRELRLQVKPGKLGLGIQDRGISVSKAAGVG